MNVLIINLTRFGDLLQTQPVVSAFKRDGHAVALSCIENFAPTAKLLRDIDAVYPLKAAKMLAALDNNWRESVAASVSYRNGIIHEFKPDMVVNLTPSVSARLLAHNIGASEVRGFSVDVNGFNADSSPWAAFLQIAGGNRGASPFNICDLFLRVAGVDGEKRNLRLKNPPSELRASMRGMFDDCVVERPAGFIAFQLGASEDRRRWPIAHFAQLADMLWNRGKYVPVILGTEGEQELGNRFTEAVSCPVVDLQGKTSLEELAASLAECEALVSNDTGTMHLAAGLGLPVVAVFLATAQPWDTGPYREGCISMEPDLECHPCAFGVECAHEHMCRFSVTPEAVFGQVWCSLGRECSLDGADSRVWKAGFNADGFMELSSLSGSDVSGRGRWIAMQRWFYRRFLDGESMDGCQGARLTVDSAMQASLQTTFGECAEYLFLLQQQAMLLARNPRPVLKEKFLATWQQLQNILNENKYLNVLALLWQFESQQQGHDLDGLVRIINRYHSLILGMQQSL